MKNVLLIGLAGGLGTIARYLVALGAGRLFPGTSFPLGTFTVNVVGCFLIAVVAQLAMNPSYVSPTARLVLATGFMGGLTTYSSFDYEMTLFVQQRAWGMGLCYFAAMVLACFIAGLLGFAAAGRFVPAG
jgi:CrcB protein